MKFTNAMKIVAGPVLTLLVAAGTHAEAYDGVHNTTSFKTREEVNAEAVRAATAPNQNVVRGSRVAETLAESKDRSLVEAEAIYHNLRPDANVATGSRFNSKVISTLPHPADLRARAN